MPPVTTKARKPRLHTSIPLVTLSVLQLNLSKSAGSLRVASPFFPEVLRKPPKTFGKQLVLEKNDG